MKKMAVALSTILAMLLYISATPVFSDYLMGLLEQKYPPIAAKDVEKADAIVILGGTSTEITSNVSDPKIGDGVDRLIYALRIYRSGKSKTILLTGGNRPGIPPESEVSAQLLVKLDVPQEAILVEAKSVNTRQNAMFSLGIMMENDVNRILLVTSAFHMKRAVAVFEHIGMVVVPAATDYRVIDHNQEKYIWLPNFEAVKKTSIALKEYIGWWVYRWRGWI